MITNMRPLTIAKLAEASGVHMETVRYYERIGLMPKPGQRAITEATGQSMSNGYPLSAGRARSAFPSARSRNFSFSPNRAGPLAPRFKP